LGATANRPYNGRPISPPVAGKPPERGYSLTLDRSACPAVSVTHPDLHPLSPDTFPFPQVLVAYRNTILR
ncbi:MAG: hypothetical protein ACUVXJ_19845, partial [Phycisphaerae bacterium]